LARFLVAPVGAHDVLGSGFGSDDRTTTLATLSCGALNRYQYEYSTGERYSYS